MSPRHPISTHNIVHIKWLFCVNFILHIQKCTFFWMASSSRLGQTLHIRSCLYGQLFRLNVSWLYINFVLSVYDSFCQFCYCTCFLYININDCDNLDCYTESQREIQNHLFVHSTSQGFLELQQTDLLLFLSSFQYVS